MAGKQQIEISFAPGSAEAIVDMMREFVRANAPLPAESVPADATTPYDLGLEPWTFHDPANKTEVMAYLDDRNQVRHVPTSRTTEVPRAWRRIWIEPAR